MQTRNDTGFTLIELMVTVAVVALVATIAVPSFTQFINSQRQVTLINELVMTMNLARSEAVKQTRHVTVCKSADGAQCGGNDVDWEDGWIVFANTLQANTNQVDAGETILRIHSGLDNTRTLRTPDVAAAFVSFRPTGTSNLSGTWILCDGRGAEHARAVVVNNAGRARATREQADDSVLVCPEEDPGPA